MFRNRGLILFVLVGFAGCSPLTKKSESSGYVKGKIYEIVVLDNQTGKGASSYFAKGETIKYDVISQKINFQTVGGETKNIKSSVTIEPKP